MPQKPKTTYHFSQWAKIRLDEMNFTLDAFKFTVDDPSQENHEKTKIALDRVYQKYSDFEKTLFKEGSEEKPEAIRAWEELETVLEAFTALTMSEKESFEIRAIAQRRGWQKTIDYYVAEVAQASGQKHKNLETVLKKLNQEKDAAIRRLDNFQKVEPGQWGDINQTLNASREAFERAVQKAQAEISLIGE